MYILQRPPARGRMADQAEWRKNVGEHVATLQASTGDAAACARALDSLAPLLDNWAEDKRRQFADFGGVPVIAQVMSRHEGNPGIIAKATLVLKCLARGTNLHQALRDAGVLQLVTAAAARHRTNAAAVAGCISVIRNVAAAYHLAGRAGIATMDGLAEAGCVRACVEALCAHRSNADLRGSVEGALTNMARYQPLAVQTAAAISAHLDVPAFASLSRTPELRPLMTMV